MSRGPGEAVETCAWYGGALLVVGAVGFGLFRLGRNITRRVQARNARIVREREMRRGHS